MRKPLATHAPVDPGPAELTEEELWRDGSRQIKGAAAFLDVSRSKVHALVRSGELPHVKRGGLLLIPKRALVLWLARGPLPTTDRLTPSHTDRRRP